MEDDGSGYDGWHMIEFIAPFQGLRTYIAFTYLGFNMVGFAVNIWVLYVVAPLLFAPAVKVPKSILFFIFALCVGDLTTMIAMLLLIIDLTFGTWRFSSETCTSYLVLDSLNKFVAPIIVFLISRTCYASVCLGKKSGERAASLKLAIIQLFVALVFVMILLSPVFIYSQIMPIYFNANVSSHQVTVIKRCSFTPPKEIVFWFNLVACITSYAIPLFGIIYWYLSVPFFLKRRALTTLVASSSAELAMKKVISTVLLLTAIYVVCWTPYWVSMFGSSLLDGFADRKIITIIQYFIHLLPYVSCVAYPLIFTLLNRGIRSAHAKHVEEQRRRFRSMTDEASSQFRTAFSIFPNKSRNGSSAQIAHEEKSNSEGTPAYFYPANRPEEGETLL